MDKHIILVIVALIISITFFYSPSETSDGFAQYKQKFQFKWNAEEEVFRRFIYLKNIEIIQKHNADRTQTYEMGVNQFTALTDAQFRAYYLNTKRVNHNMNDTKVYTNEIVGDVDWVAQGKVSPVGDQGFCGSCWAFSATGVLQSWALFNRQIVELSTQQLIDCSGDYGNQGCDGGYNFQALNYVRDFGLSTQEQYPYEMQTKKCKHKEGSFKINSVITIKGCTYIQSAIQLHPIGVSADADNWARYSKGIFKDCGRELNHDILLVGYTSTYYKIKNSWSEYWGENGYIRLAPGNTCGICDDLSPWVN